VFETRRWVTVRTQFCGVHCWSECPFEEVAFLRSPHRHIFHVKVDVELPMEQDRQIEFFMLKMDVDNRLRSMWLYCAPKVHQLDDRSCEEVATELIGALKGSPLLQPALAISVTVSEDGENGATVETRLK
jgi:hypothetical protein